MFQVASRPIPELTLPMNASYGHGAAPTNAALQLPRTLARPQFTDVSRATIAALEPELADVPVEFVRKHLASQANEMLTALGLLTYPSSLPRAHLPPTLDVPVRPAAHASPRAFPTHILAVSSARPGASQPSTPTASSFLATAGGATVPLFPAHALVLAAYCPLLPPLPRPARQRGAAALSLPLVPLVVPSAETFPALYAYLHTHRADQLLAALLPPLAHLLPRASSSSSSFSSSSEYVSQFTNEGLLRLAQALAGSAGLGALMGHVRTINGVWRNVCALGVSEPEVWGMLDVAWEVVLVAMNRAAERERA